MWRGILASCCLATGMPAPSGLTGIPALWQADPRQLSEAAQQKWMLWQWDRRQRTVQALHVEFQMTHKFNSTNGLTRRYEGTADYLRLPSGLTAARVRYQEIDPKTEKPLPDKVDEFVVCGSTLVISSAQEKLMVVMYLDKPLSFKHPLVVSWHPLIVVPWTPNWTEEWVALKPFFGAFIGMAPAHLEKCVEMQITKREDWYTYADFNPRLGRLAQEFAYARVVYMNRTLDTPARRIPAHFPRQLYWVESNKNEIVWDIHRVEVNKPALIKPIAIGIPELPQGWTLQQFLCDPQAPLWGLNPDGRRKTPKQP
jgi:hypothetical protein